MFLTFTKRILTFFILGVNVFKLYDFANSLRYMLANKKVIEILNLPEVLELCLDLHWNRVAAIWNWAWQRNYADARGLQEVEHSSPTRTSGTGQFPVLVPHP